jgi:hypothetical protein
LQKLQDRGFDPNAPVQTVKGAAQALRRGRTHIQDLINAGELQRAGPGRITTESLFDYIRRLVSSSDADSDTVNSTNNAKEIALRENAAPMKGGASHF